MLVEANELVVFGEAVVDKVLLDSFQEIPVQRRVGDEVETLFNSIPVLVDEVVPIASSAHCSLRSSALFARVSLPPLPCQVNPAIL